MKHINLFYSVLFSSLFFPVLLKGQLYQDSVQSIINIPMLEIAKTADMDGDGDIDIVGFNRNQYGHLLFYENIDGQGTFGWPKQFGDTYWWNNDLTESFYLYGNHIELADMDNDGDIDIVDSRRSFQSYPFWENDGQANFNLMNPDVHNGNLSGSFQIVDLNLDGWNDILYRNSLNQLKVNWNQGAGQEFITETFASLGNSSSLNFQDLEVSDFDLDGDFDVFSFYRKRIAPEYDSMTVHLKLIQQNPGLDTLINIELWTVEGDFTFNNLNASIADFNADNYPDILITISNNLPLILLENLDGTGEFAIVDEWPGFTDHHLKDIDLDGDEDIIAIHHTIDSYAEDKLSTFCLENNGDFSLDINLIDSVHAGPQFILGDLNNDTLPEIITFGNKNNYSPFLSEDDKQMFCRYALDTEGNYTSPVPLTQAHGFIRDFATAKWNEDVLDDVIMATESGIYWLENINEGMHFHTPQIVRKAPYYLEDFHFTNFNNDEKPDGLGCFISYNAPTTKRFPFIWNSEQNNDTIISIPEIELYHHKHITYGKIDADNDMDFIGINTGGELIIGWNELEMGEGFTLESAMLSIPFDISSLQEILITDLNHDNSGDIILLTDNEVFYSLQLDNIGTFSDWQTITGLEGTAKLYTGDYNMDGLIDLRALLPGDDDLYQLVMCSFDISDQDFTAPVLYGFTYDGEEILLNDDTGPDYITSNGFVFNIGNSAYLTEEFMPTPFPQLLLNDLPSSLRTNVYKADINNDGKEELLTGEHWIVTYPIDFLQGSTVDGLVVRDTTYNCSFDSIYPAMPNTHLLLNSGINQQLTTLSPEGHYGFYLPSAPAHILSVVPLSNYWDICPPDSTLTSDGPHTVHFTTSANTECPLMELDMVISPVRQCFSSTVSLFYQNTGTLPASPVSIILSYDERMTPLQSTPPWSSISDSTLVYTFSQVDIGETGQIVIEMEPDCANLDLGEILCFEAQITPDSLCEPMITQWDGANLQATYICEGDSIAFIITNTGSGNMSVPQQYQLNIVNDDIVLFDLGDIILPAGAIDTIHAPAIEEGYLLNINQTDGHPSPEQIELLTEGCLSPLDTGLLNSLPNNDGNHFNIEICEPIVGPYDPNIKTAIPRGFGEQHFIEHDQNIQYTIHFQNVGTDLARTVTIRDELSPQLDLASFRPGPASHPYEWIVLPDRTLTITFPEINLPDSISNEPKSHGFASYTIAPIKDILPYSSIENEAAIYFDFNPPIITNRKVHLIKKPQCTSALFTSLCPGDEYMGQAIFQDSIIKEIYEMPDQDSIVWHHIDMLAGGDTTLIAISLDEPGVWQDIIVNHDTIITEVLQNNYGCDSILLYEISVLSDINNISWQEDIQIAPNPAQRNVQIHWPLLPLATTEIKVYSSHGQLIYTQNNKPQVQSLKWDVSNWPPGSYWLEFEKGGYKARKKLLIIR